MLFSYTLSLIRFGTCALLFVSLCLAPFSLRGELKKAEALSAVGNLISGFGGGGDLVQDIGNTIQQTLQTLSAASLEQKELVIDGMFFDMAQKALQQMTGEIVTWLNSGLDGEPAFVTDIGDRLQELSDETAADFIYGDELSTVCKPFEVNLRETLAESYKNDNYGGFKKEAECSIGKDVDVENFVSGDFNAGGWSAWFEVVLNPNKNTLVGLSISSDLKLNNLVQTEQAKRVKEWDWGRGVESKKACTTVGTGANARQNCVITTPGSIMQDLASKALGTGIDSLLNADEANEVIGLLFGNLAQEAVTGVNGLLGLGGNAQFSNNTFGTGGNLSYLDAVRQEQANKQTNSVNGNKIQQALATETKVLELQLAIVDIISTTTAKFASSSKPFIGKSCFDLTLPDALSTTLTQVSAKLPKTIATVLTLQDMAETYASTTSSGGQLQLLQQLTALQSQGALSGQAALIETDFFLNSELKTFIADFKKKLAEEVKGCS